MEVVYENIPFANDVFEVASPISDALRMLGYGCLQGLAGLLDIFYDAITSMLGINIMEIDAVQQFIGVITPLGWSLLVIALIFACIVLMITPTKKEMLRGFCVAVLLMAATPAIFTMLDSVKNESVAALGGEISSSGALGKQVLLSNTIDVFNSTAQNTPQKESLADVGIEQGFTEDPYSLDITLRLPKGQTTNDANGYEIDYKWKIEKKQDNMDGTSVTYGSELGNGFFGWGEERLYAYQYDLLGMTIMMLIMVISLFFSAFKVGKTIFELITHQAIAPIVFATDIQGAGRTKKFLQSLISNYIILIMVLLLLKLYMSLMTWVCAQDISLWTKVFLIGGASWGIIDGPDVVLKIMGVDAGVKSAAGLLMGAAAAGQLIQGAGKMAAGAAHVATQAPQMAASAAGRTTGVIQGLRDAGGTAQMGHSIATNDQARMDAGVGNLSELRQGMTPTGGGDQGAASGGEPAPARQGYFDRLRDNFSSNRERGETSVGRTSASVGYAVGQIQNRMHHTPGGESSTVVANIPPRSSAGNPSASDASAPGVTTPSAVDPATPNGTAGNGDRGFPTQYPMPPFNTDDGNDDTI